MKNLFRVRGKISPRADLAIGATSLGIVVAVWCLITYGGMIKPMFLPSPTDIFNAACDIQKQDWLMPAILRSTLRVAFSLVIVTAIGVPIGIFMGSIPFLDSAFSKIVNGAKSLPTTGLVGLIVLWFGIGEKSMLVFLIIGALFFMIIMSRQAILSVNEDYVKVAVDLDSNNLQLILKVLLPGALPRIWDAIAVCNGIMWTYIVLAEYICFTMENIGLGGLLTLGSKQQDSGKIYLALIIVAVISTVTDWLFGVIKRRFFFW